MSIYKTTYKLYNGSSWDTYYFYGSAALISETTGRKWVPWASSNITNKVLQAGSEGPQWVAQSELSVGFATSATNATQSTLSTYAEKLGTSNNYYDYSGLNTALGLLAPKASPIFTGTITMPFSSAGFVKTNSSGVLSVDTTTYVANTRKVNGHALSSDVTVTASDVGLGSVANYAQTSDYTTSGDDNKYFTHAGARSLYNSVINVANGHTKSYVTNVYVNDGTKYIAYGTTKYTTQTSINTTGVTKVAITSSTDRVSLPDSGYFYILGHDATFIVESIDISEMNEGDVILLIPTDLPDFWFSSYGGGNQLFKLETTKVDLSSYSTKSETVTGVSYSSNKLQKTINGSTTDIMNLGISSGVITIGGNSITPLTSHQTMYYRPIQVAGTQKLANTASTALNFLNTGNVTFTYDSGLKADVTCITSASVSGNTLTLTPSSGSAITFSGHKITAASSSNEPSVKNTGDVWLVTDGTI